MTLPPVGRAGETQGKVGLHVISRLRRSAAGPLLVATAFLFAAAPPPAAAGPPAGAGEAVCAPPLPFAPGEECRFAVKFGFVRAGEATLAVAGEDRVAGRPVYHLVSTAESARFFSTFFPVRDRVESFWSPELRVPLRFEKHIREGKYAKDESVAFDPAAGLVIGPKGTRTEVPPGTQDVLSAFYYVRSQPLAVGTVIEVPNYSDGKLYPLQVRVLRRETVEVPAGTYRCLVVEPLLKSAGLFKQEGSLTIWLTDDARRIPVLMKSKVAVGSIVAELERYRPGRAPEGGVPGTGALRTGGGR